MWLELSQTRSLQPLHLSDIGVKLPSRCSLPTSARHNYGSKTASRTEHGRFALKFPGSSPRRGPVIRCSSSDNNPSEAPTGRLVELPLLPLPLVLFPGITLPLQIFEFRYRIMMHTILESSSLRLGIIFNDTSHGMANVGCVGEIVKHEKLVDDRFYILCEGRERFRVESIVGTKPYMVAKVQWLEDTPSGDPRDAELLADDVELLMKHVIELTKKLHGKTPKGLMDSYRKLGPTPYSFIVGSTLMGTPRVQQTLLELDSTHSRLESERTTLQGALDFLCAACAIEDVFGSPTVNEN